MSTDGEFNADSEYFELPANNAGLALVWILLFAGRWLAVPALQVLGVLNGAQVNALDHGPLLICYLLLLIAIIARAGMQAVHARETSSKQPEGSGR